MFLEKQIKMLENHLFFQKPQETIKQSVNNYLSIFVNICSDIDALFNGSWKKQHLMKSIVEF